MDNNKRPDDSLLALMADLHHEIRSPVNTIMNMTELACREQISPSIKNYLKTIEKSANTLLTLLDDIIELSQDDLDAPCGNQGFGLTDLLEDVKETVDGPRRAKGVTITVSFEKETPEWFSGPRGRIRQILTQILNYCMRQIEAKYLKITVGQPEPVKEKGGLSFKVLAAEIQKPLRPKDIVRNPRILICQRLLLELGNELSVTEKDQEIWFQFTLDMKKLERPWGEAIFPTPVSCLVSQNGFSSSLISRRLSGCGFKVSKTNSIHEAEHILVKEASSSQKAIALVDWDLFQEQRTQEDILCWTPGAHPVIFFDIPAINMMDITARLPNGDENSPGQGFVMAPSKGRQIIGEVLRLLRMEPDQLSCPFVCQDQDEEDNIALSSQELKGMKVLVVEDDRINQRIVVELLKKFGIKPVVASTGKAALTAVERHLFDAIFMDINLPDTDGYILTEKIRSLEGYSHVPIIALTASTKNRKLCLEAGMNHFLSKPYSEAKLLKSLIATRKIPKD